MDFFRQSGGGSCVMRFFLQLQIALASAPENLMRIIRCICMTDCSRPYPAIHVQEAQTPACGNYRGSDWAARTHYRCHVTITKTMTYRYILPICFSIIFEFYDHIDYEMLNCVMFSKDR